MRKLKLMIMILLMIKNVTSKIVVQTSSTINLVENSRIRTLVVSLTEQFHTVKRKDHFQLLNLQGFERRLFAVENGNIYTNDSIDREEFVDKRYCLDSSYCEIELHILVNDVSSYLIIPIHIVDENDNEPKFRENEIEMKLNENELMNNFYQIPFEGAKDVDEKGKENEIIYELSCSNLSFDLKLMFQNESMCLLYFQVIVLFQSNGKYDRLALRIHRSLFSSFDNLPKEFQLEIFAKNRNLNSKNSLKLNLHLKRKQKQTLLKFSSNQYEFVVLFNSSLFYSKQTNLFIGKVSIVSNEKLNFADLSYDILSINQLNQKKIEINSFNGDLYLNINEINSNDQQIQFYVQVSSSSSSFNSLAKFSFDKCQVKVFIRYSNLLNQISIQYQIDQQNLITQINHTNAFFIDQQLFVNHQNKNLFQIFIHSLIYPNDQFDLFLQTFHHLFSLVSSSSSSKKNKNIYFLEIKENISLTESIYNLNISIEHQLTKLKLNNIQIQLIFLFNSFSSSSTTTTTKTTTTATLVTTSQSMTTRTSASSSASSSSSFVRFRLTNQTKEFCEKNESFILFNKSSNVDQSGEDGEEDKHEIGLLRIIDKSNEILINNETINVIHLINENEIIVNECRMIIENGFLNESLSDSQYHLCPSSSSSSSSSSSTLRNQCLNIRRIINETELLKEKKKRKSVKWFLTNESVRMIMLILSLVFIFVSILLVLFICYLKNDKLSSNLNNCFSHQNKIKRQHHHHHHHQPQQQPYSLPVNKRIVELPVYSNESNEIENADGSYLYHNENEFQQEPLPSLSSLSSTLTYSIKEKDVTICEIAPTTVPPRTSSCSSFLQETKQLLDMITSSPQSTKFVC